MVGGYDVIRISREIHSSSNSGRRAQRNILLIYKCGQETSQECEPRRGKSAECGRAGAIVQKGQEKGNTEPCLKVTDDLCRGLCSEW